MTYETKIFDGQRYDLVAYRRHQRADGSTCMVEVWSSDCAHCGRPFLFTKPYSSDKFSPNRRCDKHKRPGTTVKRARQIVHLRGGKTVVKKARNSGRNGGTAAE